MSPPPLPGLCPSAVQRLVRIVEHVPMARDTWRMRLECPDVARQIVPGQFFMLRLPGQSDPLLGRPFALFDVSHEDPPQSIDFGYVVVGKLTSRLANLLPGDKVELWGPLGNGFPVPDVGRLMLVGGGIGQTPFLAVANEALGHRRYGDPPRSISRVPSRVTLCYGVRTADLLAGLGEFGCVEGLEVQIATDDGSRGHHGYVTHLVRQAIDRGEAPNAVYCCGPRPMMHATAKLCLQHGIPCWLSLEEPMACGIGACFSCVTKVRLPDGQDDYRRTCVEGPVFPAEQLVLE